MDPLKAPRIEQARPTDPVAASVLAAHLAESDGVTAQESNHTLDATALESPDIRLWLARDGDGAVLGCAALKALPGGMAEIKSVHVLARGRRRGVARAMMAHLVALAHAEALSALVLETGSMDHYAPARVLYQSLRFRTCGPIPGYGADPQSTFMRLDLPA